MNYAGLNVLSVENELGPNELMAFSGVLLIFATIGYINSIERVIYLRKYYKRALIACAVAGLGVVLAIVGVIPMFSTGQKIITATINENIAFHDITRQYEIVSNDGVVYKLKEKNKLDTYHYVCERCGKEIESGPPWLCKDCKK